jgi:SAM-dependent methyltransferase
MVSENDEPHVWYQHGVGQRLFQAEVDEVANILPRLYGYHLVFLGDPGLASMVHPSLITHRILIDPKANAQRTDLSPLKGDPAAIPLRTDSVDVVVLSHLLEHVEDPHEVLRETHRVLIPEGHVLITAFNPFSLWGIWHVLQKWCKRVPEPGRMISHNRVRDWLKLLNFQVVGGKMFYFRPPINHEGTFQKLKFLDRWGEKWWPFFGGAYSILAVKRVVTLTPIRAKYRVEKRIWETASEGLPKPTTTTAEQTSHE